METSFPIQLVWRDGQPHNGPFYVEPTFGILQTNGLASLLIQTGSVAYPLGAANYEGAWDFSGSQWISNTNLLNGLEANGKIIATSWGARLRDIDNDGLCEMIIANETQ